MKIACLKSKLCAVESAIVDISGSNCPVEFGSKSSSPRSAEIPEEAGIIEVLMGSLPVMYPSESLNLYRGSLTDARITNWYSQGVLTNRECEIRLRGRLGSRARASNVAE